MPLIRNLIHSNSGWLILALTQINRERSATSEAAAILLVPDGFVAAFGAAPCRALPALLGSLGLRSAWLGSPAFLAEPELLVAAVIRLIGGGGVLPWHRPMSAAYAAGTVLQSAEAYRLGYGRPIHWGRPDVACIRLRNARDPDSTISCPISGTAKTETMATE